MKYVTSVNLYNIFFKVSAIDDAINQIVELSNLQEAAGVKDGDAKDGDAKDLTSTDVGDIVKGIEDLDIVEKKEGIEQKVDAEIDATKIDEDIVEDVSTRDEVADDSSKTNDVEIKTSKDPEKDSNDRTADQTEPSVKEEDNSVKDGSTLTKKHDEAVLETSETPKTDDSVPTTVDKENKQVEAQGSPASDGDEEARANMTDESNNSGSDNVTNGKGKEIDVVEDKETEVADVVEDKETDVADVVNKDNKVAQENSGNKKKVDDSSEDSNGEEDEAPIQYKFTTENMRPKVKPPVFCRECNQDGHVSKKCPHSNFRVNALPPMRKEFQEQMNAACESVMQENELKPREFEVRMKVLKKLEECLRLHYKSKFC